MPRAERASAVLLASGLSSRFGDTHKLTAPFRGRALGLWAIDALAESPLDLVRVVVSAHTPPVILEAAEKAGFELICNSRPEEGMGSAIALAFGTPGLGHRAFIALADMPLVTADHYAHVMRALDEASAKTIGIPVHEDQRGHPVLFAEKHFAALSQLSGDRGASGLLREQAGAVLDVKIADSGVLLDADTPDALSALERDFPL